MNPDASRRILVSARVLWCIAGLAFVLGPIGERLLRPHALRIIGRGDWVQGGFTLNGTYPTTPPLTQPKGLATSGSWNDGDAWQGAASTAWFAAPQGRVRVYVAGYPQGENRALHVEFRHADGQMTRLACDLSNPGERWDEWNFHVPSYNNPARELRFVAEDRSGALGGWLAFSQPTVPPSPLADSTVQAVHVLATLALALTLVWLPGLLLAGRTATVETRLVLTIGAGPLALAATGAVIWLTSPWLAPAFAGPILVGLLWMAVGGGILLRRLEPTSEAQAAILAVVALCTLAATAKATYSGGPEGELYGGTISRTLAVGNRSDARFGFYTAQAIAQRRGPTAVEVERYFTPWTFFSRGPLAGLVAAPIVFATGGRPPAASVETIGWEPFDATGFAAHRVALIALAGLAVFAFFVVLAEFAGVAWALAGAGVAALSPFITHEWSFTWPKLVATAWILVSFLSVHRGRAWLGGVALGIGYLFHPLAVLWLPWLALWAARSDTARNFQLTRTAALIGGAALVVVPWMLVATLAPHHLEMTTLAGQAGFVRYFVFADGVPATITTWLQTRWWNFSNTFLPFWLGGVNEYHTDINSMYHPAGGLVKFAFSWWVTLPCGLGLLTWSFCMAALVRAARHGRAALLVLVAGPALLLVVYWGGAASGLMRECGHPLLFAVVGVATATVARTHGRLHALAARPCVPWLQLPETWLMLWLTTLANPIPPAVELRSLDPVWFAVNMGALAAAAGMLSRARAILLSSPVATPPHHPELLQPTA